MVRKYQKIRLPALSAVGLLVTSLVVSVPVSHAEDTAAAKLEDANQPMGATPLSMFIDPPDICNRAYQLGPQELLARDGASPGPACVAARQCAAELDQTIAKATIFFDRNPAVAQALDAIDDARADQPYRLSDELEQHARTQSGQFGVNLCWSALDSLRSRYFSPQRKPGANSYPVYQRLHDASSFLVEDLSTQFRQDITAVAELANSAGAFPGWQTLRAVQLQYQQAFRDGDIPTILKVRSDVEAQIKEVRAYVDLIKTQSRNLEDLRIAIARLEAEGSDPTIEPFAGNAIMERVRAIKGGVDTLLATAAAERGDVSQQIAALSVKRDGLASEIDEARKRKGEVDALKLTLTSQRAAAQAKLSAIQTAPISDTARSTLSERLSSLLATIDKLDALASVELLQQSGEVQHLTSGLSAIEAQLQAEQTTANSAEPGEQLDDEEEPSESSSNPGSDPVPQPYNDFEMMVQDMMVTLSNPLTAAEFEPRLRRKGIRKMGSFAANITQDDDAWLIQLSMSGPYSSDSAQGVFCRISASDAVSMERLRKVSFASPLIEVSGKLGEYQVELPSTFRIVFDPCTLDDVLTNHN